MPIWKWVARATHVRGGKIKQRAIIATIMSKIERQPWNSTAGETGRNDVVLQVFLRLPVEFKTWKVSQFGRETRTGRTWRHLVSYEELRRWCYGNNIGRRLKDRDGSSFIIFINRYFPPPSFSFLSVWRFIHSYICFSRVRFPGDSYLKSRTELRILRYALVSEIQPMVF